MNNMQWDEDNNNECNGDVMKQLNCGFSPLKGFSLPKLAPHNNPPFTNTYHKENDCWDIEKETDFP